MITILSSIITLLSFTLLSFAFGLGVIFGKVFFQPSKLEKEWDDAYADFQRDFRDFSDRN
ncbi:hypothetical protein [Nostoc sp.]|uniref:hypothetical protein n=1 Tax=Nostoc sp. TaxID=1180 RepID=UPI002FF80356